MARVAADQKLPNGQQYGQPPSLLGFRRLSIGRVLPMQLAQLVLLVGWIALVHLVSLMSPMSLVSLIASLVLPSWLLHRQLS
jgi:hypothetical protein